MHAVERRGGMTRVDLGRSRPAGETPAQQDPRSLRRTRLPALGALTALLVVAASWPAAASAGIDGASSGGASPAPAPAPTAEPWLLGRTAPALLVPHPAAVPAVTEAKVAPLRHVLPVDVVAVSARTLPARSVRKVRKLPGVRAAEAVDAARVQVNGKFAAVLGVNPSSFRRFAAKPTAKDNKF